jgi:hypothetical protein
VKAFFDTNIPNANSGRSRPMESSSERQPQRVGALAPLNAAERPLFPVYLSLKLSGCGQNPESGLAEPNSPLNADSAQAENGKEN